MTAINQHRKTPVTIEELATFPGNRLVRYFPYKEEVGGSSPSTPTGNACRHRAFPRSAVEVDHVRLALGPHLFRASPPNGFIKAVCGFLVDALEQLAIHI